MSLNDINSISLKVELQIPHRICAKVSQKSILRSKACSNREFWCRGYYVDTVGKNENRIAEYIKNQLKEDEMGEQLVIPSVSPFTGRM